MIAGLTGDLANSVWALGDVLVMVAARERLLPLKESVSGVFSVLTRAKISNVYS